MNEKSEIGVRLEKEILKKFPSVAELTRIMKKDKSYFTPYIKGKSVLGGETLSILAKLGLDIKWILCGATSSVGTIINEPTNSYRETAEMTYSDLNFEVKSLREEIKSYKLEIFDLERESKKLQESLNKQIKENEKLSDELEKYLERGSSKQTN